MGELKKVQVRRVRSLYVGSKEGAVGAGRRGWRRKTRSGREGALVRSFTSSVLRYFGLSRIRR